MAVEIKTLTSDANIGLVEVPLGGNTALLPVESFEELGMKYTTHR